MFRFKMNGLYKLMLLVLLFLVNTIAVVADTNCSGYNPSRHPIHYCDCRNDARYLARLPFDVMVTDSIWFECSSNLFTKGFTAYLYSDCDVQFDIYQNCTAQNPLYSVVIPKGQARDVTAESINQKLEEMGMTGSSMGIYLCIHPIDGTGGRLMCLPYNTGYNSTCSDILSLLPGMTFVSSHAETVYEITPDNIADSYAMYLQWNEEGGAPCELSITRGSCNGAVVAEHSFTAEDDIYLLDAELLMDVCSKGESLYAHFSHNATAVGRINFREATFVDMLVDTVICSGKVFQHGDYVTTESGVYRYDTVQVSPIEYEVKGYNIIFAEPEVQYDTLALRNNQLPYDYRGEVIDAFGDYEFVIETDGECDEHIVLNVLHNLTTITHVKDTTICYGGRFDYGNDSYMYHDVTLADSTWNVSHDTLTIDVINVYFNSQDFAYDTLALTKEQSKLYRYEGTYTIRGFGDYQFNVYDKHNCPVLLYLNVCHKVTNITETVDSILCAGEVYVHTDGVEYRNSAVLVDSGWVDDDTYLVKTTTLRFISNELTYDTLTLRYSDLPYLYKNQVTITEMADTTVSLLFGKCSGQVLLRLVHLSDTISADQDTTLCEGKVYVYNGVQYNQDATIVDSTWMNRDTLLATTTRVHFVAPEVAYDTIALRSAELPFVYREQYTIPADGFGNHEMVIRKENDCNERIALCVMHMTDTVDVTRDTTLCEGKAFEYNGELYFEPVVLIDSTWANSDTLVVTATRVHFTAPEPQYDTLGLKTTDLPYLYRGQYSVDAFGNYETIIRTEGECDELYRLHIYHNVDTVVVVKDSLICYGGRYQYEKDGRIYTVRNDISFGSQIVLNADTVILDSLHVRFAKEPDNVYDTIVVPTAELIKGYRYDIYNKTINSADDYEWVDVTNTTTRCKENVYLHVVELAEEVVDVTVCQGKGYELDGVVYYESVTLIDSAWVNDLKFQITTTRVNFVAPVVAYDTIAIRAAELPYNYRGEMIADFGEYDLMIKAAGECDERVMLLVNHSTATVSAERDTTLCQGKSYNHNGEIYYEAVELVDSAWTNRDTMVVTTTRVYFAAPVVAYDTIAIRATELPYNYRGEMIADFGEYDLMIKTAGECDERIMLYVSHLTTTLVVEKDTTLCQGKGYEHDGEIYYEAVELVDSVWTNRDTMVVTTTRVYFVAPEVAYDTIAIRAAELPYNYRGEMIADFGEYDLMIKTVGECDERVVLLVNHSTATVTAERDTTLCQGKGYEHDGEIYYEAVELVDSVWTNRDTLVVTTTRVYFAAPEMEYDTVMVETAVLVEGYYYEIADEYVYEAGEYEYEIVVEGECTRLISLVVEEIVKDAIDDVVVESEPKVVMIDGILYIHHNGEYYTLTGQKIIIK